MLLYPGFKGRKEDYSGFASNVASAGYVVMVLQQLQTLVDVPSAQFNIVTPTATAVALEWLQQEASTTVPASCCRPDTGTVLLVGHSYGCSVVCRCYPLQCYCHATLPRYTVVLSSAQHPGRYPT
ncbi:MAG: hypothetical protein HC767_08145 [Akkermansiaceae bacterium]|nr:hypothetical protein [Akkermansiaceae bacterium]